MEVFEVLLFLSVLVPLITGDGSTTSDLLWPQPSQMKFGSEIYSVEPVSFTITTDGNGGESTLLKSAIDRYYVIIFESSTPFYPSGNTDMPKGPLSGLKVTVHSTNYNLTLSTDESCKNIMFTSC